MFSVVSKLESQSFFVYFLLMTCESCTVASVISSPQSTKYTHGNYREVERRQQTTAFVSTCGFKDGDAGQPRTANSGFDCRVDTMHAIWGFCPTTVIAATDCGLAGNCVDSHDCSTGCGIKGTPGITTFTWYVQPITLRPGRKSIFQT